MICKRFDFFNIKKPVKRLVTLRKEGLEPSRPKAVTGSLVLRVCQFRHFR